MFLYSTKSSQLSFMERYHKETLAKARARTFPYYRYSQEEINAYNTVNLVHLCIYISENAVSYQAGKLVVRSAPYVIIYPEGFYDTKSRKCYTAVNGLKAFFGFDFLQALYIIKSYFESEALFHMDDYVNEHYPLICDSYLAADYNLNYVLKYNLLDRKDNNSLKMVYSVLHNRMHIERDVITKFLRTKKLIVYGGFDLCFLEYLDNNVIAVTRKLQNKDHMATEVMTVKRNTTFTWDNDSSLYYHNVYIFEDVYQIMSYLSLIERGLVPPLVKNNIMLSLNGMSFDALKAFLKEHSEVKAIYACLSNTAKNNKQTMIDVLIIKAGCTPERNTIASGLESLQSVVGGYIEAIYPFEERVGLLVNADGKLEGLEPNRALYDDEGEIYDIIVGDFCIVGLGEEDFTSLSTELMEIFEDRFYSPELFMRMNDKLIALPYLERRK